MFVLFTPSILQYPYQHEYTAIMTHKYDKMSYFATQNLLGKTVKTQCKQAYLFTFPNRKHLSAASIAAPVLLIL